MRFLLVVCFCFFVADSSAVAQQTAPSGSIAPAPALQTPQTPGATPQTRPQPVPDTSFNFNDLGPAATDDLDLDSNRSFDFDDSDDSQFTSSSDFESSIASNSNFRGASPQMIGDFGGGSNMAYFPAIPGFPGNVPYLESVPVPLAGGSRRIKMAENNQVMPLDRVYGTFNYFHNAYQGIVGSTQSVRSVHSESLIQYTVGVEKTLLNDYFSLDLRMPFTGGVDLDVSDPFNAINPTSNASTGRVGNLSTSIKAYLLGIGQTSISGGLQISVPTGSDAFVEDRVTTDVFEIKNDAVHLMPFVGVYRPFGDSWWLQAFTQIDTPANGNRVLLNGVDIGRLTEQTLLYSDVSLGKWLYRNPCNSRRRGGRGVTGIASIFELHYTGSLTDADQGASAGVPGVDNRFDVLNLTTGLLVEFGELWRINTAYVTPLTEGRWDVTGGGRQDNRFFDGELSIQVNRFF